MAATKQERGIRAQVLLGDEILREALEATRDWAMSNFNAAKDRDSAWDARLRVMAVEEFAAYLLATIQFGRAEVDELVRARDKLSKRKQEREELSTYLENARKARAEFEADEKGVAS